MRKTHLPTFVEKQRSHFYNRSRVDANQKSIVSAFRSLGWYVMHTHDLKKSCDLIILKEGRVVAIEIKDGTKIPSKRKLSPGETEFKAAWLINGGEWRLVESTEDVLLVNKRST